MRVKKFFTDFNAEIRKLESKVNLLYDYSIDTLSAAQLSPLLGSVPYLPYTQSSLRYSSISYVLNDVVINKRNTVVEFGSGISTVFLSKLLQTKRLNDTVLISIDNNEEWLKIISSYIDESLLESNKVILVNAKLTDCSISLENNLWYDITALSLLDSYKGNIDCVLVDGPEAWRDDIAKSRYPALPFINDYLKKSCSIFLDDSNRKGERLVLEKWKASYDFKYEKLNSSFSRLYRGESFNIK